MIKNIGFSAIYGDQQQLITPENCKKQPPYYTKSEAENDLSKVPGEEKEVVEAAGGGNCYILTDKHLTYYRQQLEQYDHRIAILNTTEWDGQD